MGTSPGNYYGYARFSDAKHACETVGKELPLPKSKDENLALLQLLQAYDLDSTWLNMDSVNDAKAIYRNYRDGQPSGDKNGLVHMVGFGKWQKWSDWNGQWNDVSKWNKKVGYICIKDGDLSDPTETTTIFEGPGWTAKPTVAPGATCLQFLTGGHKHSGGSLEFLSYDASGNVVDDMSMVGTAMHIGRKKEIVVCSSTPVRKVVVWNPTKDSWGGTISYGGKSMHPGGYWIDGDSSPEIKKLSGDDAIYFSGGKKCEITIK